MKIYYITNSRIPTEKAHGIQIMKMCEAFAEADADIELVVPKRKNPDFKNMDPFDYYGAKKNFVINYLNSYDPVWLMRFPRGWYIKVQASLFMLKLHSYLQEIDLTDEDILYTRDEYLLSILLRLSASPDQKSGGNQRGSAPVRVIWEAHNLPRRSEYYLKYWKNCHRIIAITQGLKNELASLGIDENKILVAPDGVDLKQFELRTPAPALRDELGLPQDKRIVMYAGHFYQWKGAQTLADAADFLGDDVAVVFFGGTETDFKKFKAKNSDKPNVYIFKHRPHHQVPKLLNSADLLVLPTSGKSRIGKKYTSPMKLFEYMAAGKPIVASNLPSIREILYDPRGSVSPDQKSGGNQRGSAQYGNAVLVEPDDPKSLADGIQKPLRDRSLAEKIAGNAFQKVKNYTWQERAEKILGFIK